MNVVIDKFDHLGNGIAKVNGEVIFVKKALPNEEVEIDIFKENKHYKQGNIKKIIVNSKERIEPICPYYNECGGCNFLHCQKNAENTFKINKAKELFDIDAPLHETLEYHYRNKVTLHVKDQKIGYYKDKSNEIVDINYCYLLDDKINNVLNKLHQYLENNKVLFQEVIIRCSDTKTMLIIDNYVPNNFIDHFNDVDNIVINKENVKGKGYLIENVMGYQFKISPYSFFQVNKKGLEMIFKIIDSSLKQYYDTSLDLYGGTGVMGILISKYSKKVISIESNVMATSDGLINKNMNNLENIEFINSPVKKYLDKLNNVDLIIIDPPRSGLDDDTINYLKKLNSKTIIYISCNMNTLKRDLDSLQDNYKLLNIELVDMFPKTIHVECVCILDTV